MSVVTALPKMTVKPVGEFQFDMRRHGWELIEDNAPNPGQFEVVLREILRPGEDSLKLEAMREERSRVQGCLAGQRHLERMLLHQKDIPAEWRWFSLVAPGTLWHDGDGYYFFPYMFCQVTGTWSLDFIDSLGARCLQVCLVE